MEEYKGYSSYDFDRLNIADSMKIERNVYLGENADISGLTALPLDRLQEMREENAAAEQRIFEALQKQAAAWEAQAGKTLAVDKAIEYVRIPEVKHTQNQWEPTEYGKHISNRVYQMNYRIWENSRYDMATQQSKTYSYSLSWNILTNSPNNYGQAKIAGQDKKVFADKAAMEKYLNGRIKAYAHLFTEISPPIPKEYADHFKVNGQLLPGYSIEGEERKEPVQTAQQTAAPQEHIDGQFAIFIDSKSRAETAEQGGVWLSMPATKEQLQEAMKSVGITADNPQDFFIGGYSDNADRHIALPYDMVCAASVDELNFLAVRLTQLDTAELPKLNAALQQKRGFETVGQVIDFTYNADYFVHIPEVHTSRDLGNYYLNKSGMVQMPEEWKSGVDPAAFGRNAAEQEQGSFTEYGYLVKSGDEWERKFEGREVPEEYRIMSYPALERGGQETAYKDEAAAEQEARPVLPEQPRPVIPITLTSEKPAEKMKEITDRLEQGITELFDSERYKEYLQVMSRFHNYSFNNTVLIAMQKPDASLIAGFNAWKNNFGRNVMKGQKGIKIIAPSPFKVKQQTEKIDPQTRKPVIGKDGKPVMEEKEVTIPAYKVVSVFDVSQTEGKELPSIAVNELTGDVESYKDFFKALEQTSPVPIGFEKIEGGAHGYYHLEDKRIAIDEGMSELQTVKTAIHEIAHAKLHDIDLNAPKDEQEQRPDRRTREVEAESVAYTVCQHYGLDTSDYSFGYVAGWSSGRELAELKGSLETIRSTAAEIINSIDEHIAQIQKEQDKEQAAPAQEQPEPIYKVHTNPRSESNKDRYLLQAYHPQEDGKAKIGDVLYIGTPQKCRELMAQLVAGELTQEQVKELYTKAREQPEIPMPDPTISVKDMQDYGYSWDGMLPLQQETAERLFHEDLEVFRIYEDGSEGVVTDLDDLRGHAEKGGLFGVDKEKWQAFHEYNAMKQERKESEPEKEALLLHGKEDTFGIYQLAHSDTTRDFRFEPYDRLQAAGKAVERANYELIYTAPLTAGTSLEDIFTRFNTDHPQDFKGHSLSVSDIVVLHQNGENTAHYVDRSGYKEVPEFLQPENPLKAAEQTTEQNYNMIDGQINNTPTAAELEAKAKAGEQISLFDYAKALKEESRQEKAAKPEKKPSIRAQLKADKERAAQKKPAKQKSQDMERS